MFQRRTRPYEEHAARGDQEGGSYGTEKAKINSERLRPVVNALRKNGSILILISQSRDRIGFGAKFDPKTRGGGNAPTFSRWRWSVTRMPASRRCSTR